MNTFDPEAFMQTTVDAPLDTEYLMVPEGEYVATIDDFDATAFEQIDFTYKKGEKSGLPGTMTKFTVPFVIQDDRVKQEMSRDKVVITKQLILDMDGSSLDTGKGKNVELGRVRAAAGQADTTPWSPLMLRGTGPVMIKVVHRSWERTKDGTKGKRAEVDRVVRIS